MKYINKKLIIEKVSVESIAKKYGTPSYCYSYDRLKKNIINFKKSFPLYRNGNNRSYFIWQMFSPIRI